jgi:hypothetical protein
VEAVGRCFFFLLWYSTGRACVGGAVERPHAPVMKERTKVFIPFGWLGFGGIACFLLFFVLSHAVPIRSFGRIAAGMSEPQVRSLLGVPRRIRHDRPGTTAYFYGGFQGLRWCTAEVYFDADGRVTGTFHDH